MDNSTSNLSAKTDATKSASNVQEKMSLADVIRLGAVLRQSNTRTQERQYRAHPATLKDAKVGPYRVTREITSPRSKQRVKKKRLLYTDSETTPTHIRKHKNADTQNTTDGKMSLADRIKAKRQDIEHLDRSRTEIQPTSQQKPIDNIDEVLEPNNNDKNVKAKTDPKIHNGDIPLRTESDVDKGKGNVDTENKSEARQEKQDHPVVMSVEKKESSTNVSPSEKERNAESQGNQRKANVLPPTTEKDIHSESRGDENETNFPQSTTEKDNRQENKGDKSKTYVPSSISSKESHPENQGDKKRAIVLSSSTDEESRAENKDGQNINIVQSSTTGKDSHSDNQGGKSKNIVPPTTEKDSHPDIQDDKSKTNLPSPITEKDSRPKHQSSTEKDSHPENLDNQGITIESPSPEKDGRSKIQNGENKTNMPPATTEKVSHPEKQGDKRKTTLSTSTAGKERHSGSQDSKTKIIVTQFTSKTDTGTKSKSIKPSIDDKNKNQTKTRDNEKGNFHRQDTTEKVDLNGNHKLKPEHTKIVEFTPTENDQDSSLPNDKEGKALVADTKSSVESNVTETERKNEVTDTNEGIQSDVADTKTKNDALDTNEGLNSDLTEIERKTEMVNIKDDVKSVEKEAGRKNEIVNTNEDVKLAEKKTIKGNVSDINEVARPSETETEKKTEVVNIKVENSDEYEIERKTEVVNTNEDVKETIKESDVSVTNEDVKSAETETEMRAKVVNTNKDVDSAKKGTEMENEMVNSNDKLKLPEKETVRNTEMVITNEHVKSNETKHEKITEVYDNEHGINNEKDVICVNDEGSNGQIVAKKEKHSGEGTGVSKQDEINANTSNKDNDKEENNENEVGKPVKKNSRGNGENKATKLLTQYNEPVNNNSSVTGEKNTTKTDTGRKENHEKDGKGKPNIDNTMESLLLSLRSEIDEEQTLSTRLIEEFQDFHDSPLVKFSKAALEVKSLNALDNLSRRKRRKRKGSFRSEGHMSDSTKCSSRNSSVKNARLTQSDSEIYTENGNIGSKISDMETVGKSESSLEQTETIANNDVDKPYEKESVIDIDKKNTRQELADKTNQDSNSMDSENNKLTHGNSEEIDTVEGKTVLVSDDIEQARPDVNEETENQVDESRLVEVHSENKVDVVDNNSDQNSTMNQKSENTDNEAVLSETEIKPEQITSLSQNIDKKVLIVATNNETSTSNEGTTEMKQLNDEKHNQDELQEEEGIKDGSLENTRIDKSENPGIPYSDTEIKTCQNNEPNNGLPNNNDKEVTNNERTENRTEEEKQVCHPESKQVENKQKDISSDEKQIRKRKKNTKIDKNRRHKLRTQNSKTNVQFIDKSVEGKLQEEEELVGQEKDGNDNENNSPEEICDTADQPKDEICEDVNCHTLKLNKNSDTSNEKLSSNKSKSNFIYPSIPKTPSFFNLREFKQACVYERKRSDHHYGPLPVTPSGQVRRNSSLSDPIKTNYTGQSASGILKNRRHSSALSHVTEKDIMSPVCMQDKHASGYSRTPKRKFRRRKGSSSISFKNLNEPDTYYMRMNLQDHYLEDAYEYMRIDRLNKEAFDMSDDNLSSDGDKAGLKLPPLSGNQQTRTGGLQNVDSSKVDGSSPPVHHVARERSFFYITPLHRRGLSFTEINKTLSRVDEILKELSVYKQGREKRTETKHGLFDCRSTLKLTCNEETRVNLSIDQPRIIYDNTKDSFRTSKSFEESSRFSVKSEKVKESRRNRKSKALNVLKRRLKMNNPVIC